MIYLCTCGFVHDRLHLPLESLDVHANSTSLVMMLRNVNNTPLPTESDIEKGADSIHVMTIQNKPTF
jgi:copper(I)-binding protein